MELGLVGTDSGWMGHLHFVVLRKSGVTVVSILQVFCIYFGTFTSASGIKSGFVWSRTWTRMGLAIMRGYVCVRARMCVFVCVLV